MKLSLTEQDRKKLAADFRRFSAAGWLTPILLTILCLGVLITAFERGHGNLQRVKDKVDPPIPDAVATVGPGGQDPIRVTRSATAIGRDVEFLSATMLPGRGMNVLQITAMIPGHGEVPLIVSPNIDSVAGILSGTGEDANGSLSTSFGGAFLLPWADSLTGTPTATPGMLSTLWNGKTLTFPASSARSTHSVEGLMLNRGADSIKSDVLPDGQYAEAVYNAGDFGKSWPSNVEVTVLAELSAHTIDFTLTARNAGQERTPFAIGWHPYFAILSGDRSNALLKIPSNTIWEFNHHAGVPTGRTVSVADSPLDFTRARGTKLGSVDINETYTKFQSEVLSNNPGVELRDLGFNVMLRIVPLTPNITNLRVSAPANKQWISIGPNTNAPDPLGPEWKQSQDSGMVTLAPGATMQWKVRLEISAITGSDGNGP